MLWITHIVTIIDLSGYYKLELVSGPVLTVYQFFFSSRRRHTRLQGDWSSDVCSSELRIRHTRLQGDWSSDVCSSDLSSSAIRRSARPTSFTWISPGGATCAPRPGTSR